MKGIRTRCTASKLPLHASARPLHTTLRWSPSCLPVLKRRWRIQLQPTRAIPVGKSCRKLRIQQLILRDQRMLFLIIKIVVLSVQRNTCGTLLWFMIGTSYIYRVRQRTIGYQIFIILPATSNSISEMNVSIQVLLYWGIIMPYALYINLVSIITDKRTN